MVRISIYVTILPQIVAKLNTRFTRPLLRRCRAVGHNPARKRSRGRQKVTCFRSKRVCDPRLWHVERRFCLLRGSQTPSEHIP